MGLQLFNMDGQPLVNLANGVSYQFSIDDTTGGGELPIGAPIAQVDFRESPSHGASGDVASELRLTNANVVVKAMGCEADVSAINFAFGSVNLAGFDDNPKAGSAPTQDVNLSCEPGTDVSLTVNAAEATGDNPNHTIIALTNSGAAGVASGVGVQLGLKSSDYDSMSYGLPLNRTIPLFASTRSGQSYINGGTAATEKLTFSAVYYRTAPQVVPGIANATATMTLTYN
jgi:type 1 fimbria pilin